MQVKEMGLSWIVVKDLKAAIAYYTEVVGLQLAELHERFGWAELQGHGGGNRLGIAQENPQDPITSGQNAVITFTVEDLEQAKAEMSSKGAECVGEVIEVPGHVKMQTMKDIDGNFYQICQRLPAPCCP